MNVHTSHRLRDEAYIVRRYLSEAFDRLTAEQQFAKLLADELEAELSGAVEHGEFSEAA